MNQDKIAFNDLLQSAGLNKKQFSKLTGVAYGTVANWGAEGKPVPSWVASWIDNYLKARVLESVEDVICKGNRKTFTD